MKHGKAVEASAFDRLSQGLVAGRDSRLHSPESLRKPAVSPRHNPGETTTRSMSNSTSYGFPVRPLGGVAFGHAIDTAGVPSAAAVERFEADPRELLALFYAGHGLLVVEGLCEVGGRPELLVRMSRLFGPEVENYRQTLTTANFFHDSVDEILVLSNLPPCSFEPPPRPAPPVTEDGGLPIRFPHRRGWHTDQSYRRPPPDVSLLLGVRCPAQGQGQTLYADCISAYASLPASTRDRIADRVGLHAMRGTGRSEPEVLAGAARKPLLPHQMPQGHRLVRTHPITGEQTLYLCDGGQMDFVDGPIVGLAPGPGNTGAELLRDLLEHITESRHVYVHEWNEGDLVIHDNRTMLHTPTWYDSAKYPRVMWRTTVTGNPGVEYADLSKSWIPAEGGNPMAGLEDLEF